MSEFGVLSVVPPLIAIALAIVTRKAVLSLFLGVWAGAIIFTESLGLVQRRSSGLQELSFSVATRSTPRYSFSRCCSGRRLR